MNTAFPVIANVNYGVGLCLNLIVLFFLLIGVSKRLGSYRYLHITFIIFNVTWTTFCWQCMGKLYTTKSKFCLFLLHNWFDSLHFVCLYNAFFSLFMVVVPLHFLYRYWMLYSPSHIKLFSGYRYVLTLCSFAIPEFAIWYAASFFLFKASDDQRAEVASALQQAYGIDALSNPMIIGEYFRDGRYNLPSVAGLLVFVGIVVLECGVMLFCTIRIYVYLAGARTYSVTARKFHRTIFVILIIQNAFPLVLIHINVGAYLIAPLFAIEINLSRDFTVLVAHFFVPLDALAILTLLPEYRRAI
ncbi:hypothetical protein PMAYCL1PPCAC_16356, partial [Pristionchus mayeri]